MDGACNAAVTAQGRPNVNIILNSLLKVYTQWNPVLCRVTAKTCKEVQSLPLARRSGIFYLVAFPGR